MVVADVTGKFSVRMGPDGTLGLGFKESGTLVSWSVSVVCESTFVSSFSFLPSNGSLLVMFRVSQLFDHKSSFGSFH